MSQLIGYQDQERISLPITRLHFDVHITDEHAVMECTQEFYNPTTHDLEAHYEFCKVPNGVLMQLFEDGIPKLKRATRTNGADALTRSSSKGHGMQLSALASTQKKTILTRWYVLLKEDTLRSGWAMTIPKSFYRTFDSKKHQPLGFYSSQLIQSQNPVSLYKRGSATDETIGGFDASKDDIVPLPAAFNKKKLIVTQHIQDSPVSARIVVASTRQLKGVVFPDWPDKFFRSAYGDERPGAKPKALDEDEDIHNDEAIENDRILVDGRMAVYNTQHVLFNVDCKIVVVPLPYEEYPDGKPDGKVIFVDRPLRDSVGPVGMRWNIPEWNSTFPVSETARGIVFAVDRSSSMSGAAITMTKVALCRIAASLGEAEELNAYSFGATVHSAMDSRISGEAARRLCVRFFKGLCANQKESNIVLLLQEIVKRERSASIILATDIDTPLEELEGLADVVSLCRQSGLRIFTIGLGTYVNQDLVRFLTRETLGGHMVAFDEADTIKAIKDAVEMSRHDSVDLCVENEEGTQTLTVSPGFPYASLLMQSRGEPTRVYLKTPAGEEICLYSETIDNPKSSLTLGLVAAANDAAQKASLDLPHPDLTLVTADDGHFVDLNTSREDEVERKRNFYQHAMQWTPLNSADLRQTSVKSAQGSDAGAVIASPFAEHDMSGPPANHHVPSVVNDPHLDSPPDFSSDSSAGEEDAISDLLKHSVDHKIAFDEGAKVEVQAQLIACWKMLKDGDQTLPPANPNRPVQGFTWEALRKYFYLPQFADITKEDIVDVSQVDENVFATFVALAFMENVPTVERTPDAHMMIGGCLNHIFGRLKMNPVCFNRNFQLASTWLKW